MAFFKTSGIFEKNNRLHRLILSYMPVQEREDFTKPFEERSVFEKRKEFDAVIEEMKLKYSMDFPSDFKDLCKWTNSIGGKYINDLKDLTSYERERIYRLRKNYLYLIEKENLGNSAILGGNERFIISSIVLCFRTHKPKGRMCTFRGINNDFKIVVKGKKTELIEFLKQNGFKLTTNPKVETLTKMFMSF